MGRHVDAFLQGLLGDERGTTSIEYALIGTLVGVACIGAFTQFASVTGILYEVITGLTAYL
ncbi:MAG: Flp family type IVb pilin [Pseudomonadota bacterium]|nr:Flp family type IVb pilin [Pseudomonadota bacterium]